MLEKTPARRLATVLLPLIAALLLASGCGGSGASHSTAASGPSAAGAGAPEAGAALAADARSAATGDIPDTQNFLTLNSSRSRVSMLYPEGWAVQEAGGRVSITNNNNLVRISLSSGPPPTVASVQAQLEALKRTAPSLAAGTPSVITLKSGPALKVAYKTQSAPSPVTGKQVTLSVDRYVLGHAGRVAVVELGTPVGVDNVDAYKRMIESFKWL